MRTKPSDETNRSGGTWTSRLTLLLILIYGLLLAIVAFSREAFNYHTETDFVGSFALEATRFLHGESLEVLFHPPLYAMVVGLTFTAVDDWFTAGLIVSLLSGIAALLVSWALLRRLLGVTAAVAGVAALALSPTFAYFSMKATSDVFSLALHLGAMLAVVIAAARRTPGAALVAGLVIGLALLTRTNNVVLLALFSFYLLPPAALAAPGRGAGSDDPPAAGRRPWSARFRLDASALRAIGIAAIGMAVPLIAWAVYANATGSPLTPRLTYENLALTYFAESEDRISGDARLIAAAPFESTLDVLTADPARIARIYLDDFLKMGFRLLLRDTILPVPLVAFGSLAWLTLLVIARGRWPMLAVLLANLLLMILLLNMKAFENRYFMFLLPFLGAAVGSVATVLLDRTRPVAVRTVSLLALALALGFAGYRAVDETHRRFLDDWATDAHAAAEALAGILPDDAVLFAQRPHLGFLLGLDSRGLPDVDGVDALLAELADARADGARVFLHFGVVERRNRPRLGALGDPDADLPAALAAVARGAERDGWVVYEVLAAGPDGGIPSP